MDKIERSSTMNSFLIQTLTGTKTQVYVMRRSLLLMALATTILTLGVKATPGLNYSYYEGTWTTMPEFSSLTPSKSGVSSNIDLGVRNRDTYFSVLWQGYITIPADGIYTFELTSDDGSKMYLGNYNSSSEPWINNDGVHPAKTVTITQFLYKGLFPIAISYFQSTGWNQMEFYWSSNSGISRQRVPDNVFSSNYTGIASSFSGLNYSYVEGAFTSIPDFYTQKKVKTGNSTNIDLGISKRNDVYSVLWEGYINIPADGIYTFETNSDDGSKLYLGAYNNGESPLVNNDGLHPAQVQKGVIALSAGVYPISISFLQNAGNQVMELYWSSNTGISRQQIPDNAFISTSGGGGSTSSNGPVNYKYFEGSWTSLPDLTSLTPTKAGTTASIDLGVAARNVNYAVMFQTNITIPSAGVYTFETNSDDGTKLYLGSFNSNTTPVVGNDGMHLQQIRTGTVTLSAGVYSMTVMYFQSTGDQVLDIYWSSASAGIARAKLPNSLFTTNSVTVDKIADNLKGGGSGDGSTDAGGGGLTETGGLTGSGNNYYFSTSTGDDSRSNVQAMNPNTPWKTIDKMNSIIPYLGSGDAILLKRGEVFDGAISIKRTSNQSSSIIFSSYGTGSKPIINGFATLYNWSNLGNGIWSSYYNFTGSRLNVVTINGQPREMGRYPNANDPIKGYLTYDSHTYDANAYTGSITDNQFNSPINWTGGELALRKRRWVVDQCPITYQSGNTFYYKSPSFYPGLDGFGFYIQNHPKTLDQFGEWYYDLNSKYLQVYFGSNNPNNFEIKQSSVEVLFTILGQSNITMDNLTLQGANSKAFSIGSCNNIKITNCNVLSTGVNAVDVNFTNNLTVENCNVRNTNNTGMFLGPNVNNSAIRNNTISTTGVFPGMGANSDNARQGLTIVGDNDVVEYNEVDSSGYSGIKFKGNNIIVRNNVVNTFCFVADDGGGIYTYSGGFYGRKIQNNIVVNGVGASDGTDSYYDYAANGIDLDDMSNDVEMTGNSIASCNGRGIGNHNSHELVIDNNTVYDCDMGQVEFSHDLLAPNDATRNVTLTNNILVSKRADQQVMIVRTKDNDVAQMGNMGKNIYSRPIDDKLTISTYTYFNTPSVILKYYDLPHWKSGFGFDPNSSKSPVTIPAYSITGTSGNVVSNGSFNSNIRSTQTPTGYHTSLQYDNNTLDGGALKVTFTGNSGDTYQSVQYYEASTPNLQSGHTYRVKFSAVAGNDNNADFYCTLPSAYGDGRTDARLFKVNNKRSEIELLFTPNVNVTHPYLEFYTQISTECPVFWLDNLVVEEVYSMTKTNPSDYFRFEYNGSTSARTIPLDGIYRDMKSNTYNYSITLSPYTSAVLVRNNSSLVDASEVQALSAAGNGRSFIEESATASTAAELSITPNPAVNKIQLTMKLPQSSTGKATLTIYAASGAAVNTREVSVSGEPLTIDVSTLSKGVYTVNLVYGKRIITKRFVKM